MYGKESNKELALNGAELIQMCEKNKPQKEDLVALVKCGDHAILETEHGTLELTKEALHDLIMDICIEYTNKPKSGQEQAENFKMMHTLMNKWEVD